jgi:dTDP-4-dehydrorhamnose 3,5-epimerase
MRHRGGYTFADQDSAMDFERTNLEGAWLIRLQPAHDERGFFARTFCEREFSARGLNTTFPQHSTSFSARKGTLRGMHFQREPHVEVKLVRCLHGAIFDVIIDVRPHSSTYRRWQSFELTAENRLQLYIPSGFAHGFQTLSDEVEVGYLISEFYNAEAASGLKYDDPTFAISWPLPISTISDKDRGWPMFTDSRALAT